MDWRAELSRALLRSSSGCLLNESKTRPQARLICKRAEPLMSLLKQAELNRAESSFKVLSSNCLLNET